MGEHWRLAGVGTGILLLILLLRQGEQFPHRGQVLGAPSVGEQSVVADAVEAGLPPISGPALKLEFGAV